MKKETTDSYRQLDIRQLKKIGALKAKTFHWSDGEGDYLRGSIIGNNLFIDYRLDGYSGEDEIFLNRISCHFGGQRFYFLCPDCGKQVSVLYIKNSFKCRYCRNLTYHTQQQSPRDRILAKEQKIRIKLGASLDADMPIIDKPKGMHLKKFIRLREQAETANSKAWESVFPVA